MNAAAALPLSDVIGELEIKARRLIIADRDADRNYADFSQAQTVRNVFTAMWSSSLSIDQIAALGAAMNGWSVGDAYANIQPTVTRLVKTKLLRSRVVAGRRLYELAL